MKRRVMSVVLSAAMALSLAVPTMAVETPEKKTGTVTVEEAKGGMIRATANGKVLPIGETVELPAGTNVYVYEREMYYYDEDDIYVNTKLDGIYKATSSDAEKELLVDSDRYSGSFRVEAGDTISLTAEFVQDLDETESSHEPRISMSFETYEFDSADDTAVGKNEISFRYIEWNEERGAYYVTKELTEKDFASIEMTRVSSNSGSEKLEPYKFEYKDGVLTWTGKLAAGYYGPDFEIVYEGKEYTVYSSFHVGTQIYVEIPLGYYLFRETANYTDYSTVTEYLGQYYIEKTADITVKDAIDTVLKEQHIDMSREGIYGYDELVGWATFDYSTGKFEQIELDEKLSEVGDTSFYAIYANKDGKQYEPKKIERLDETVDPSEVIPDTETELKDAVEELPEEITTAAEAEEFDKAVETILSGIKKVSADTQMKIAASLGTKLKSALGLELEPGAGIEVANDSIFVAAGLTSSKDEGATVALSLKNVATSANASKPGEFTVEMNVIYPDGETKQVSGNLQVPVEVTVTLPADMIASMADAAKTYVVKIGGKEIEIDKIDEENHTITFTTSMIGNFIVTEKTAATKPDDSSQGGSSGSGSSGSGSSFSSSSSKVNTNASGKWIQSADGRWWFQYTRGGYPASKWELINNKWYYFNAEGYMVSGWQLLGNVWYHLDDVNGDMTTGWYHDAADGKWYYFNARGEMLTGWQKIDGAYYYLSETAEAPTYTYDAAAGKWVYNASGARPYGSMYANETTPDGSTVDASGARVQ